MGIDFKKHFVEELKAHYRELITGAHRAETTAGRAADAIRSEARGRDDAKAATAEARMALAHGRRRLDAKDELETLLAFVGRGLPRFGRGSAVALGALIDVSIEDPDGAESEERTLFLLPVGAGTELTGPGGDGYISVITPTSPVGRALLGAHVGDTVEVTTPEHEREWTVIDLM